MQLGLQKNWNMDVGVPFKSPFGDKGPYESHCRKRLQSQTQRVGPAILADSRGFKVSYVTVEWYRSSFGTDFENSETASPGGSS